LKLLLRSNDADRVGGKSVRQQKVVRYDKDRYCICCIATIRVAHAIGLGSEIAGGARRSENRRSAIGENFVRKWMPIRQFVIKRGRITGQYHRKRPM
jgi:hypothetical protein